MGLFRKKHVCAICDQVITGTYYPISNTKTNEFLYDICSRCKSRYVAATNSNGFPLDPADVKSSIEKAKNANGVIEVKVYCETCKNVYCYTDQDLIRNIDLRERAQQAANSAVTSALFVSSVASNQQSAASQKYLSQIVDYHKCPKCGSTDVVLYDEELHSKEEPKQEPQGDIAEALKKFKDLLDNGIITQEEFDAKKKQLLGL